MPDSYRLDQIYSLLVKRGQISVDVLADYFKVTPTTIRRDLLLLEERGLIFRTRGSAIIKEVSTTGNILIDEKKRIAKAALNFVTDDVLLNSLSLAIDSGSTTESVIDAMIANGTYENVDIVTNSLINALKAARYFRVSMPGGAVFYPSGALVGGDVESFYAKVKIDIAFIGSTGVANCNGLTVAYPLQLTVKQKLVTCANLNIALLDSSKFLKRGVYEFCTWEEIDYLITVKTEENASQLDKIEKRGVKLILV